MRVLADPSGATSAAIVIAWSLISAAAYFTPAIVALVRRVPNAGSVIVIDLLLGRTIVGWIVALAMACRSKAPRYYAPGYYPPPRSEEHTSELQSHSDLVCRLLLEK